MKRLARYLVLFVALLLFGCEQLREEYYGLFLTAVVVDQSGEPIQGICAYPEGGEFQGREGYSDHLGRISAFTQLKPRSRWIISFADVDGEYNGGVFKSVDIDVTSKVTPPSLPDDNGYTGSCLVNLDTVVMSRL